MEADDQRRAVPSQGAVQVYRRASRPISGSPIFRASSTQIEGIPKSFVYDRGGKLVAQSIDMRTMRQFQEMLSRAGLE